MGVASGCILMISCVSVCVCVCACVMFGAAAGRESAASTRSPPGQFVMEKQFHRLALPYLAE